MRVPCVIGKRAQRPKAFALRVAHVPRLVVDGAGDTADERKRHLVLRREHLGPLVVLGGDDGFAGRGIRQAALETGRLEGAVEVGDQAALRGLPHDAFVEPDRRLVVAIHEVDHHTGGAPRLQLVEHGVHVAVDCKGRRPEHDAEALAARLAHERRHVEPGRERERIAHLRPARVEEQVPRPEPGGEVDVVAVGRGVQARLERDVVQDVVPEPLRLALAGSQPRSSRRARVVPPRRYTMSFAGRSASRSAMASTRHG